MALEWCIRVSGGRLGRVSRSGGFGVVHNGGWGQELVMSKCRRWRTQAGRGVHSFYDGLICTYRIDKGSSQVPQVWFWGIGR